MGIPLRVLLVEDCATDALLVAAQLERGGYDVDSQRVDSRAALVEALDEEWDVVIADFSMPGFSGLNAFEIVRERKEDIPFILVSGTMPEEDAVAAMRSGIRDFILKDHLARLVPAIARELHDADNRRKHRAAEVALRESNEKLSVLVQSSPTAIITFDRDVRVTTWNPAATRLFGWEESDVVDTVAPVFSSTQQRRFRGLFVSNWRRNPRVDLEFSALTANGNKLAVIMRAAPLRDAEGDIIGGIAILADITDRKRAEHEQKKLIKELETKNVELERFTYAVSHDLKSPLITIKGFMALLAQEAERGSVENMDDYLDRINRAADKMTELLDDLLQLSRVGRLDHPPESVQLGVLVRDVLDLVSQRVSEAGVHVKVAPSLPAVHAVRPRLFQAMENLVNNAIKFTAGCPSPTIEIEARQEDGEVVVSVRDNGIGIDPKHQERVFALFDKLDRNSEGTGVGLALVKRIAEMHGGRVWVESDGLGHGSAFSFSLPDA